MTPGRTLPAALVYFAMVFVPAFGIGVIRTLVIAPRVGDTGAVLLETPVILVISWYAARWTIRRFTIPNRPPDRLAMGFLAFLLLMATETGMSIALFGRPPAEYFASFVTPAGAIGLLAQAVFGLIPYFQARISSPDS